MTRKSIVLSDVEKTNKKAVLTMEEKDGKVVGSLRLYNFSKDVDGIISLGIYYDDIVTKCGLTKKQNMYYEFFTNLKQFNHFESVKWAYSVAWECICTSTWGKGMTM